MKYEGLIDNLKRKQAHIQNTYYWSDFYSNPSEIWFDLL